jgi:hypothetical protein
VAQLRARILFCDDTRNTFSTGDQALATGVAHCSDNDGTRLFCLVSHPQSTTCKDTHAFQSTYELESLGNQLARVSSRHGDDANIIRIPITAAH